MLLLLLFVQDRSLEVLRRHLMLDNVAKTLDAPRHLPYRRPTTPVTFCHQRLSADDPLDGVNDFMVGL